MQSWFEVKISIYVRVCVCEKIILIDSFIENLFSFNEFSF